MNRIFPQRRMMLGAFVFTVLAAFIWFTHASVAQTRQHGSAGGPIPVVIATAKTGSVDIIDNGLGTVTPLANIVVRTQINGQLMEVGFKEGQIVKKGDFLAEIDPRPYELSLKQARGALERDQALLKEAQLNLARYKTLVAENSIARQQLDTQQSLVGQYAGDVKTDQAQIDTAKLNLNYCHITAPISGRVGLRQVDQGNYVQVGDTNGLVTLTQLQPVSVIFALPEDDLPLIMQRLSAGAVLPVTALDRTQSTKLADGKLISVDNQIDTSTGTIKLRAQFDNTGYTLFPNQFVNIALLVNTLKDVVTAPTAAIQRGEPGTFVYLVGPNNKVSVRKVALGPQQGETVAVIKGLVAGDKVVVEGAEKLRDGAEVAPR